MLPRCLAGNPESRPVAERERPAGDRPSLTSTGERSDSRGPAESDFKTADRTPDDAGWRPLIDPISVIGGVARSAS